MAYTAIDDSEAHFITKLYTGNGGNLTVTGVGFQPDFVWFKTRDGTHAHAWVDDVRGTDKVMHSNTSQAEQSISSQTFNSDGYALVADGTANSMNSSSSSKVAWNWKESATAGFDMVAYTGNGTDDTDISHSLSAVPHVMIVKNRTSAHGWNVYHHKNTSAPETDYLSLDENGVTNDSANSWSDEAPTSSVFTLGGGNGTNKNTDSLIAYLWSEKQGFSKFGLYYGNGANDGPFVYTGFRPAFVMVKASSRTGNWGMNDNKRDPINYTSHTCDANNSTDADDVAIRTDLLSNGFKIRTDSSNWNASGSIYIFIAFAESPFVNSSGVPNNAR